MIIIISGIDKVGKTTLAKNISRQLGFKYIKFEPPKKMRPSDTLSWAKEVLIFHESILIFLEKCKESRCKSDDIIIDRFYPDEIVYSSIFRGIELFDLYKEIDSRFAKLGVLWLYVSPKNMTDIKNRWIDEKYEIEMVPSILHKYLKFLNYTNLHFNMIDNYINFGEVKEIIMTHKMLQIVGDE